MAETYQLADALKEASELLDARQDAPGDRLVGLRLHIGTVRALVQAGERLQRILLYPSERCEFATDKDPHDPVEYSDADGVPMCGECYAEAVAHWKTLPVCPVCHGIPGDVECERCEGRWRVETEGTDV